MPRNTVLSIIKGFAIILMVIGHAEAPELITNFIYTFHMPVFFIAAGYFFSRKYVENPWSFCVKRFKGLYVPFVKWSLMFLLLHNIFFHFGILNEEYGNWTGGVTHPYEWGDVWSRLLLIFTSMNGYDEFMAGAFWFFRGLLIASILFLVLYKLVESKSKFSPTTIAIVICISALAFTAYRISNGLTLRYIPNGGMREIWGMFFFGIGFIFHAYEERLPRLHWIAIACFVGLCVAAKLHLCGMNNHGQLIDILTLPLTGTAGFFMLYYLSTIVDKHNNCFRKLMVYIGNNTMAIFVFHIISFKLVSLLKIWAYDLDFAQIGCHMVIHYKHTDIFWVIYSIVGTALPLVWLNTYRRIKAKIFYQNLLNKNDSISSQ